MRGRCSDEQDCRRQEVRDGDCGVPSVDGIGMRQRETDLSSREQETTGAERGPASASIHNLMPLAQRRGCEIAILAAWDCRSLGCSRARRLYGAGSRFGCLTSTRSIAIRAVPPCVPWYPDNGLMPCPHG